VYVKPTYLKQLGADMARKKMKESEKQKFQNVGLIKEDHDLLRLIAEKEQRSMARQLSVLIRQAHDFYSRQNNT
jgi:succinate dehydrogenase flavin-adding protein (antitoxin of CptAB toxin-antitoxin module)|tara:strand:- start:2657 stop:2878 length:222 start_codon:yes stop_codon:yes gene_type:complete